MLVIDNQIHKIKYFVKDSQFICLIKYVTTKAAAEAFIKTHRRADASHNCYCYLTTDATKHFDDQEPTNTAGLAMLNFLIKEQITNIVVLNIRYVHKSLLGKAGLIAAYKLGVKEILNNTNLYRLENSFEYEIKFSYENQKIIAKILYDNGISVTKKNYQSLITNHFEFKTAALQEILEDYAEVKIKTITKKC